MKKLYGKNLRTRRAVRVIKPSSLKRICNNCLHFRLHVDLESLSITKAYSCTQGMIDRDSINPQCTCSRWKKSYRWKLGKPYEGQQESAALIASGSNQTWILRAGWDSVAGIRQTRSCIAMRSVDIGNRQSRPRFVIPVVTSRPMSSV
jgi:hypothetical protein